MSAVVILANGVALADRDRIEAEGSADAPPSWRWGPAVPGGPGRVERFVYSDPGRVATMYEPREPLCGAEADDLTDAGWMRVSNGEAELWLRLAEPGPEGPRRGRCLGL